MTREAFKNLKGFACLISIQIHYKIVTFQKNLICNAIRQKNDKGN